MEQYLELLSDVYENGVDKKDRTGVGTRSVFGRQVRYDISNRTLPLVTTKKIHLKSVIYELLWFLKGDTNVKYLQDHKVRIWDEWADEHGNLGPVYGKQWVAWDNDSIVKVEPRICTPGTPTRVRVAEIVKVAPHAEDSNIGKVLNSSSGYFQILDKVGKDSESRPLYRIQFLESGYIATKRLDVINACRVSDPYYPSVSNVGYRGEYEVITDEDKLLKKTWHHMIERCYNTSCKEYPYYGGSGVFVDTEWHCFANFVKDVKYLPNWHKKKNNPSGYQLDKDYFSSNCYSKDTCVWLTKADNILYRASRAFKCISPSGDISIEISHTRAAEKYGLERSKVSAVLRGERSHHKKWTFEYVDDGELYRYGLPINQVAKVVELLKNNPDSRRIIITAWNPSDLPKMALSPCHALVQFYVNDGKLSCQLYQRSADIFLGVPFNIASYAILTQMLAQVCGLEAHEFIHTFGDLHIYNNHFEQVEEQLERQPYPAPKLVLNPDVKDIFEFQYRDFALIGYKSHPKIEAEVAV